MTVRTMTAEQYLDLTPTRALLGLPTAALDEYMATAYQLWKANRFADAEIVCRGLLALDHRYWWAYALHASVLLKLGRFADALGQVNRGLRYEPGQPKLVILRTEILKMAATIKLRAAEQPASPSKSPNSLRAEAV